MLSTYCLRTLQVACLGLVVSSLACSVGSPGTAPTATLAPSGGLSSSSPVSPTTAAQAGTSEVVVTGDLELRFQPVDPYTSPLVDRVTIALLEADLVSGVLLFVPRSLQPGTYPIGDLFHLSDSEITARLDHLDRNDSSRNSSWESIEGTLVLTETGDSLSGSFSFTAVRTPEGSESVTVAGNFEGVPVVP